MGQIKKDLKKAEFSWLDSQEARFTHKQWIRFKVDVFFIIMDASFSYNAILGNTTINPDKIIPSMMNQNMKFPTPNWFRTVLVEEPTSRWCHINYLRRKNQKSTLSIGIEIDSREEILWPPPFKDLIESISGMSW